MLGYSLWKKKKKKQEGDWKDESGGAGFSIKSGNKGRTC